MNGWQWFEEYAEAMREVEEDRREEEYYWQMVMEEEYRKEEDRRMYAEFAREWYEKGWM